MGKATFFTNKITKDEWKCKLKNNIVQKRKTKVTQKDLCDRVIICCKKN